MVQIERNFLNKIREKILDPIHKDLSNEDPELKVAALKGASSLPISILKVITNSNKAK